MVDGVATTCAATGGATAVCAEIGVVEIVVSGWAVGALGTMTASTVGVEEGGVAVPEVGSGTDGVVIVVSVGWGGVVVSGVGVGVGLGVGVGSGTGFGVGVGVGVGLGSGLGITSGAGGATTGASVISESHASSTPSLSSSRLLSGITKH